MERKPSFPVANCNIKMPDCLPNMEAGLGEDENEQQKRRQQLINFGHSQWGFKNWNWSVTKQDMDFVDFANGKYCVGVVAFVSITVKTLDLQRENIGYATSVASTKGMAIYKSRKCAVTNALRETLLSFGGNVATELLEVTAESARIDVKNSVNPAPESPPEVKPVPRPPEPKNLSLPVTRKELNGTGARVGAPPPVARAHPMPANLSSVPRVPSAAVPPPAPVVAPVAPPVVTPVVAPVANRGPGPRNQNVSFVLQPVMGGMMSGLYAPRLAAPAPPIYPDYYECAGPWHFTCDATASHPTLGPREEPAALGPHAHPHAHPHTHPHAHPHTHPHGAHHPQSARGCWIKPTMFYNGFWTEQKVKRWVAEQVEKRFPGDPSSTAPSPDAAVPAPC